MIEIIDDIVGLKSIADSWDELSRTFETPLLQYDWMNACVDHLCPPGQLRVVVNHCQGELTAIAPLALIKDQGIEKLELLSAAYAFEPSGFIYKNKDSLRELVEAIIQMKKPLALGRIRQEAEKIAILQQSSRGMTYLSSAIGSPYISINTTWDRFEAGMSSDYRNELRRKKKLLAKHGKMSFEVVEPTPETLEIYLDEFMHVEAASWKGRERSALLFDERLKPFYIAYARAAALRGIIRIFTLRCDTKAIAGILAVEDCNGLWTLKLGYDEEWMKCAPGILLVHETIRYAFEKGLRTYEFLGTEAPWIRRWTRQVHPYVIARFYPYAFAGIWSLAFDAFRSISSRSRAKIKQLSS